MSTATNVQRDLHQELLELKQQLSLLQKKDRQKTIQIQNLKHQISSYQKLSKPNQVNYDTLFENAPIAIFRTNARTGEILNANPKLWKILGCDPQSGISTLNFYANPEDRADFLRDLMEYGKVEDREILIKKADRTTIWATLSAIYCTEDETVEGVMMDISGIKDSLVELQRVNYELDNFVYQASHDLRAPLRSILGLINLLRLEKTESGKEHCLEMIEGSIRRLDQLVIDLLQISRDGRDNISLEPVCLITEINNSLTNFCHAQDSESVRIITKISQPVDLVSDLTRIRIVLNNLVSNAIKYRNPNSDQSYILISARVTAEHAEISVKDNGQGIPQSKLSHIFEMFVRATDSQQGSGLGLYIVKNVVEKLGGRVKVQSQVNSGSNFTVLIPNPAS